MVGYLFTIMVQLLYPNSNDGDGNCCRISGADFWSCYARKCQPEVGNKCYCLPEPGVVWDVLRGVLTFEGEMGGSKLRCRKFNVFRQDELWNILEVVETFHCYNQLI